MTYLTTLYDKIVDNEGVLEKTTAPSRKCYVNNPRRRVNKNYCCRIQTRIQNPVKNLRWSVLQKWLTGKSR